MDFYKGIYIVYLILVFYTFYTICAMMNIADCKLWYSNNIIHNQMLLFLIFNLHLARILPCGLKNYICMKIWSNDNVYKRCTNANIPHINIKMLTMSSVHWWLVLHVPETVLIDNNLHCFKPIPTHCNSFAGNVSPMWLNIHSAWAQDLGQQSEECMLQIFWIAA